ncbi:MAG: peroxide stress protein YaaA [Comamonadaceae bacterium]|nr:peroxide stress protein YaaA [Comamonadaceae bacterium]
MLFLLSPAKALDYDAPAPEVPHTQPQFVPQAAELIGILKQKSPQQIAALMGLSDTLSGLNVARYQAWRPKFTPKNAKQAVLAFDGDAYHGLAAADLALDDLKWLQQHLCILSGLYGVLRPLDLMQAYRLEMGTQLPNAHGKNLYEFWGSQIARYLNNRLKSELAPVVVNLASQEYFKAVDLKSLKARVVDCVFEDFKGSNYKIISFYAKRARGLMARFAAVQRVVLPEQLKAFDTEGYGFDAGASGPERLVFRRRQAEPRDL